MTGAKEKSEKRPDENALKNAYKSITSANIGQAIGGVLNSGTYIGNAVGQSFTYTANSLNLGGSTT